MNEYITKSTILERKYWTEKALNLFIPAPNKEVPNPHAKKAPPMKLYLLSIVEEIEKSDNFKSFVEKNNNRVTGAKRAVETKRKLLVEYVKNLNVEVPHFTREELIEKSCRHFNDRIKIKKERHEEWLLHRKYEKDEYDYFENDYEPDFSEATPNSDISFLNRICLNYVRHLLTDYESELKQIEGKVGHNDVYELLKERINDTIKQKYTWLIDK